MQRTGSFVAFSGGEQCSAPVAMPDAPRFPVPAGACDAHAHVFADAARYPLIPDRNYTPALVGEAEYLALLDRLRLARGVLVQPSVYGTDNSLLLSVLARHPDRLRGVVVIDEGAHARDLQAMHALGVRGVRLNLIYRGGVALDALERLASRIRPLGWHVQLLIRGGDLPGMLGVLRGVGLPVVLDHMAQMPFDAGFDSEPYRCLYALLDAGRAFVKLSAANRFGETDPRWSPQAVARWQRRLAEVAPHACVWGSDWPHVGLHEAIDTGALLNDFAAAIEGESSRARIMSQTSAALYGFDA